MQITSVLVSLTKGEHVPTDVLSGVDEDVFWETAERHGVSPLVAEAIAETDEAPPALRATARTLMHHSAAADLVNEVATRRLVVALEAAGVRALLMKGGLLAYTHYPRPDLRPRADTDVLIELLARRAAHEVLVGLGYRPQVLASSDLVLHQRSYLRTLSTGQVHVVDVHWRVTNPEVFGGVLTFQEMAIDAVCVPRIGCGVRGLSAVHSLLVACVHRVAHHSAEDRLIWLYDIHLLATKLEATEWERFVDLAISRRVVTVCRAGLNRCVERFGTLVPELLWDHRVTSSSQCEATAVYLMPNRSQADAVVADLRALPTWAYRWRLIRDYAFPPVEYMRDVYAPASAMPLLWLYVRRILFGARKWVAPRQSGT